MENEKALSEIQKENRKLLPFFIKEIQYGREASGVSDEIVKIFATELHRKEPFQAFDLKNANNWNPEKREKWKKLQDLATFYRDKTQLGKDFFEYMNFMDIKPYSDLGTNLGYMVYCFGPGEGLVDETTDKASDELKKTLNDKEPE